MRTKQEIAEAFAPTESLSSEDPFYLVGIGGAGMSALARMLKNRGLIVRGSDSTPSATTAELEASGIAVRIGHSGDDVRAGDQVVLSDAIHLEDSPEVDAARRLGCGLFRRSQLLGWLLRGKKIVAVTGTHGKTTVTAMIGAGLRAAGMDPTVVVGAEVPEFGGAVVEGTGEYAVVEACEAYDSFHDLEPYSVVLTSLEPDHLDFHGTWENLLRSVTAFVEKIGKGKERGQLFYFADDGPAEVARRLPSSIARTPYAEAPLVDGRTGKPTREPMPELALPGRHNRANAEGALLVCLDLGAEEGKARRGIAGFRGAERRLQIHQESPCVIVDDYAHHPTEVRATTEALREKYPGRRLIVVFQPHLYSRTAQFTREFAGALSLADHVVLTDIYPAREEPMPGVSSARIAELVTAPVDYVPCRHVLPRFVKELVKPGDVVVGMGAGSICEFVPALLAELRKERPTRVAVIYGGDSAEREVSLHSGREVAAALKTKGYSVELFDVSDILLSKGDLSAFAGSKRPDLAFLCVHGTNAEDGAIQGLFELLHIPYTGSGILASALAMDKQRAKQILAAAGVPVPKGVLLWSEHEEPLFPPPYVVKPNAQGSTVGISFVERAADLRSALRKALRYGSGALVEERIEGTEISVPVLAGEALPIVEIVPKAGVYDFASKYLPEATEEIIPARISPSAAKLASEIALEAHRLLGCRDATRSDMMVRDEEVLFLEINTIPGMTATSLLPNSARAAGISFEELCHRIAQEALARHASKT